MNEVDHTFENTRFLLKFGSKVWLLVICNLGEN